MRLRSRSGHPRAAPATNALRRSELEVLMAAHPDPNRPTSTSAPDALASWMADGLCREIAPEVFFPSTGSGVVAAQKICRRCPVAEQCLDYALEHRIEFGVWGGVSERGRRRVLSARRADLAEAADAPSPTSASSFVPAG
jgi:WhiB family transcriptional regulator, redox-sensing transcriptional regulator